MTDMPSPPLAPPTEPGHWDPDAPQRAAWPVAVGIVQIVFGGFGMFGAVAGVVMSVFFTASLARMSYPDNPAASQAMIDAAPINVALSVVQLALATLLLAAGIGMVSRKPWSVSVSRLWAVVKMIVVIGVAFATAAQQSTQFEAQSAASPNMPAGFGAAMYYVVIVATILWGWALPVFVLVWLQLPLAKREVTRWREPGAVA